MCVSECGYTRDSQIKSGVDVRDLPPPEPTYDPSFIQCPNCARRFNQQVRKIDSTDYVRRATFLRHLPDEEAR